MGKLILQNCFCMGWARYDQQLSLLFEEVVDFVMSADMKGHPHYIFQALCMISKLTLAWITTRRRANAKWGQRVQIRPFVISCWEGSVAGGCGARLQISAFLPFVVMTLSPCGIKTCCLSSGISVDWSISCALCVTISFRPTNPILQMGAGSSFEAFWSSSQKQWSRPHLNWDHFSVGFFMF